MKRTALLHLLLVAATTLATTLSIAAWLNGAHVTPDQALWHALSIARSGGHQHTTGDDSHRHTDAEPTAPDLGLAIPAAGPHLTATLATAYRTLWLAVVAAVIVLAVSRVGRLARGSPCRPPASITPHIPLPPPR